MDISDKVDVLIYLVSFIVLVNILAVCVRLKNEYFSALQNRYLRRLSKWDDLGEYEKVVKHVDLYIREFPGETNFKWLKARSLYKLGKYDDALEIYKEIDRDEPLYSDDAQKYIANIESKTNA